MAGKKINLTDQLKKYFGFDTFKGKVTKVAAGVEIDWGVIYNKDQITGKEEFGYVFGGQGKFGIDYNFKKWMH